MDDGNAKELQVYAEDGKDRYYSKISDLIGLDTQTGPGRVKDFIQKTLDKRIIFHGIRTHLIDEVDKNGVLNLTPEGSQMGESGVSFWTSGHLLFGDPSRVDSGWLTYDTTFFHWAVGNDKETESIVSAIAISSKDRAGNARGDEYVKVPEPIAREDLHLAVIHCPKALSDDPGKDTRVGMFETLEWAVDNFEDCAGGTTQFCPVE